MNIKLCSVVAMAHNNAIGVNNSLPWKLPSDLSWFKQLTNNHVIIMGHKTWDSLPKKPLPNRYNIVITSRTILSDNSQLVYVDSPNNAYSKALFEARRRNQDRVFVIGGETIYNAYSKHISILYNG